MSNKKQQYIGVYYWDKGIDDVRFGDKKAVKDADLIIEIPNNVEQKEPPLYVAVPL